jgi:hypothetical protein
MGRTWAFLPKGSAKFLSGPSAQPKHQALTGVSKAAASVFRWDADHPHPFLSVQGVMFSLSPDQLANAKDASFDYLLQQYSTSHPVRELEP